MSKKPFKDTKLAKLLGKAGKAVINTVSEGALQSVPGGNAAIKLGTKLLTIVGVLKPKVGPDGKTVNEPNWFAVGVEVVLVVIIVYSFFTKAITLDELIAYLEQFIP